MSIVRQNNAKNSNLKQSQVLFYPFYMKIFNVHCSSEHCKEFKFKRNFDLNVIISRVSHLNYSEALSVRKPWGKRSLREREDVGAIQVINLDGSRGGSIPCEGTSQSRSTALSQSSCGTS